MNLMIINKHLIFTSFHQEPWTMENKFNPISYYAANIKKKQAQIDQHKYADLVVMRNGIYKYTEFLIGLII